MMCRAASAGCVEKIDRKNGRADAFQDRGCLAMATQHLALASCSLQKIRSTASSRTPCFATLVHCKMLRRNRSLHNCSKPRIEWGTSELRSCRTVTATSYIDYDNSISVPFLVDQSVVEWMFICYHPPSQTSSLSVTCSTMTLQLVLGLLTM